MYCQPSFMDTVDLCTVNDWKSYLLKPFNVYRSGKWPVKGLVYHLVHLAESQTKSINIKPDSIVVFQEQDSKGTPDWDHVSFSLHIDKTCLCDFLSDSQTSR